MGGTLADTLRGLGAPYTAGSECVIADDDLVAAVSDVDAGRVVLDVNPCEAFEPKVQSLIAAIETAYLVVLSKLLDDEFSIRRHQRLSATEPLPNKRFNPVDAFGGASSALTNAFHALGGKTKWFWSARCISACVQVESTM
jgi:hypothetical protein